MQISLGTFAKRRNSTKQPASFTDVRAVNLKEGTSEDRPTFILSGDLFGYNYVIWGTKYYFIVDIKSLRNGITEVSCVLDVLATYKSDILASTQFVSYSSQLGDTWLEDTRIPVKKNAVVSHNTTTMNFLFNTTGFYVLSVVGKSGCDLFALDQPTITNLLNRITNWSDNLISDVLMGMYPWSDPPQQAVTYDFTTPEKSLESMAKMNALTGFAGNAYSDAPNCIRSCIWVPFFATFFTGIGSAEINLGQFETGITAFKCKSTPAVRPVTVNIPWQHTDWRRATCEDVYLYLPMVGLVNIPSDEIVNETTLSVTWSATATDGCISFLVKAGNQVVGTYGANTSVNYPLGISQQSSAGEIVQTAFQGAQKTISSGISAASSAASGDAIRAVGNGIETGMNAIDTVYQTINTSLTRHNTCIGGIGGGSGCGLDLDLTCFTVNHDTIIAPSQMQQTMGLPTMKPMSLGALTGYCQCANAHVEAAAQAEELDAIDSYLNTGFYIE